MASGNNKYDETVYPTCLVFLPTVATLFKRSEPIDSGGYAAIIAAKNSRDPG